MTLLLGANKQSSTPLVDEIEMHVTDLIRMCWTSLVASGQRNIVIGLHHMHLSYVMAERGVD